MPPTMENPLWDQICRGLLYQAKHISMKSQQLQGQIWMCQPLKNVTLAGHNLYVQQLKREIRDPPNTKGRQILMDAARTQ